MKTMPSKLGRRDAVASLGVFGVGVGSLFILDITLSARLADQELADWALTRNAVLFGAVFCLLGSDQAILRAPSPIQKILVPFVAQASLLAIPVAAIIWISPNAVSPIAAFVATVSLSLLAMVSGINRATYRVSRSHAAFHLWKLALFVAAIWASSGSTPLEWVMAVVLACWALVAVLSEWRNPFPAEIKSYFDLLPVGIRFWLSALVAGGLAYADQVILNLTSSPQDAAHFFRHVATFLPVSLVATSFSANLVNPFLRSHGDELRADWRRLGLLGVLCVGLVVLGSLAAGFALDASLATLAGGLDWALVVSLGVLAATRTAYVLPSAVVGVFGRPMDLDDLIRGTVVSLPLLGATYWAGMSLGAAPPLSLAIALSLAGLLRTAWSARVAHRLLTGSEPLELKL